MYFSFKILFGGVSMVYNNSYISFIKLNNVRKIHLSNIIYSCSSASLDINNDGDEN